MPATKREAFALGVMDGLIEDATRSYPDPPPDGWMAGYVCAMNTARGLLAGEISADEHDALDGYVEVAGVGGAKP